MEIGELSKRKAADYAASLDSSIEAWTNSLVLKEISESLDTPGLVWSVDNTPREWLGHRVGGIGVAGDNPDAIYRTFTLLPGAQYEVTGCFDREFRATQLVCEMHTGSVTRPHLLKPNATKNSDFGGLVAAFTDRDFIVSPDGQFRMTFGGGGNGPNHVELPNALVTGVFREVMSDWRQRACHLTIRRTDSFKDKPLNMDELVQRVAERCHTWQHRSACRHSRTRVIRPAPPSSDSMHEQNDPRSVPRGSRRARTFG